MQVFTVTADVAGTDDTVHLNVEVGDRSEDDDFIKGPPGFRSWTNTDALEQAGWQLLPRAKQVSPCVLAEGRR